MSIDRCMDCASLVDTDFDDEAYHEDGCICLDCREERALQEIFAEIHEVQSSLVKEQTRLTRGMESLEDFFKATTH